MLLETVAVFEIALHCRLSAVRALVVDPVFAAVREQSRHGYEMSKNFLFDATLPMAVEFFDNHQLLGYLVEFLNAPASMVQVGQIFDRILVFVEQRGSENVERSVHCIFNQAYAMVDLLDPQFFPDFRSWTYGDYRIGPVAGDKGVELAFSLILNTG